MTTDSGKLLRNGHIIICGCVNMSKRVSESVCQQGYIIVYIEMRGKLQIGGCGEGA